MNIKLVLSMVAAVAVGVLIGPASQPALVDHLPAIGWSTLAVMFVVAALAPPGTLLVLAQGERYVAMARAWSGFFFVALFLIAAGVSAVVFASAAARAEAESFLFLVWGSGMLSILGLVKLRLLYVSRKKAARATGAAEHPVGAD